MNAQTVWFVVLESIARQGVIVKIARRANPAIAGPTRASTADQEKLRRLQDHSAQTALRESTKSVRQRVKIAQQENILPQQWTRARTVMWINFLYQEAQPARTVHQIHKLPVSVPHSQAVAATPDSLAQTAGRVRVVNRESTSRG